jgi:hypothetical protein
VDITTILTRKFSNGGWVLTGNDYSGLEWLSETKKPTKTELEKLWPIVQAEIEAEKQAKIDARNSAIAKLEALGLTVEEVSTVFGLEVQS